MKIRFKQLIVGYLFINMCGCSGAPPFKDAPIKYTPTMMNEIYKQVKTYPEHPYYSLSFSYSGCAIEIWINDMVQFGTIDVTGGFSNIPLNIGILNSGIQKLMIRIYSPYEDKRSLKSDSVTLEVKVEMNNEREDLATSTLYTFKPKKIIDINGKEVYDFDGKNMMEYNLEFNAKVPYNLIGWTKSKDLRKVPDIEQKVKDFYSNFREKFASHDSIYFANAMYKKEVEIAQSLYLSGFSETAKRWNDLLEAINDEKLYENSMGIFKDIKLKDQKLEFYGDGRVAGLIYKGKVAKNARGVGYISKVKNEDGKEYDDFFTFPLYLHIPEGSTELEIIR
ncbi:MAG: hypothetical protein H7141_04215 [Burkholderiales bacterium]|nr:hypothetical protein [Bacteroidia bacterium]